jgi:1-acyl-sn-glycerol-3-phosphate acyltransferase
MRAILYMLFFLFVIIRQDLLIRMQIFFHGVTAAGRDGRRPPAWLLDAITRSQLRTGRLMFYVAPRITGFRIECEPFSNGSLPHTFLLVTNHQSLADIPVLYYAFPRHPLRFVLKRELGRGIPMISLFTRVGGHALISRTGDFREGRKAMERLASLASEFGICPVIFPEGRRSKTGRLLKFNTGAFRIVLETTPLPVLSVAMDGGHRISKLTRIFTNMSKTRYRVKPLTLYPPPKGKREILDLLGKIEAEIGVQLGQWRDSEKREARS